MLSKFPVSGGCRDGYRVCVHVQVGPKIDRKSFVPTIAALSAQVVACVPSLPRSTCPTPTTLRAMLIRYMALFYFRTGVRV